MNKFKVGDRVVRTGTTNPFHNMVKGNTYTVDYVSQSGHEIRVRGSISIWGGRYFAPETAYPNPPHKHCDVMIEYARGADIEVQEHEKGRWHPANCLCWNPRRAYRVKVPAPVTVPIIIDGNTVELSLESAKAIKKALRNV